MVQVVRFWHTSTVESAYRRSLSVARFMSTEKEILTNTASNRRNFAYLQEEALTIVAVIGGIVGYVWIWTDIWPVTGYSLPLSSWIGGGVLLGGALFGYQVRRIYLHFASYLLVMAVLLATTCAVLTFHGPAMLYLFTLPIIFGSVLLGQRGIFLIAFMAACICLTIQFVYPELETSRGMTLLPAGVIACLTVASWLSARNLYATLAWFGEAYASTSRSEQIARDNEAALRRALKALDDMTYRLERTNYTLTVERNQAQEAKRLKQQFAQTISHELRTPLNIIVAFTELMAQSGEYYGTPLPFEYMRDLSVVHRNAKHLQTLVNDVLDLAQIEAAQMAVIREEADPAELAQEAVQTARSLIEMRGLKLNVQVEASLPKLWVDTTRIRQVLFNLLSNAARFTERGSITVKVERRQAEVVFSVIDTGIGIAPEDMQQLFIEFHQLHGGTRRPHGGAGLGLAISRRFVELHHGHIWVESQPGNGSTFSFSLPIMQVIEEPTQTYAPTNSTPAATRDDERIVIAVTRSPSAAGLLTRHLQGCRTIIFQDLEQTRQAVQRLLPQCIVIDTAHETLTTDALQSLAQQWQLQNTPLIACPLPGKDLLRQQLAVTGYLVKPVSMQSVQDALTQISREIKCVLAVDDNHDFVQMLTRLLNRPIRPLKVVAAYSAKEGLALIHYHHPDVIFLDWQLPDMNGLELIEQIRALPGQTDIPIVIVSGEDTIDLMEPKHKPICYTKLQGVTPGDIVHLIQGILENEMHFVEASQRDASSFTL